MYHGKALGFYSVNSGEDFGRGQARQEMCLRKMTCQVVENRLERDATCSREQEKDPEKPSPLPMRERVGLGI